MPHLERSLALNPRHFLTHLPMAHAKMYCAQALFRKDPANVDSALQLLDEATAHAQALLDVCPMYARAHDALGRIASISAVCLGSANVAGAEKRVREYWLAAEGHLTDAARYGGADQGALYRALARVRVALGDVAGAEAALVQAAAAEPGDGALGRV